MSNSNQLRLGNAPVTEPADGEDDHPAGDAMVLEPGRAVVMDEGVGPGSPAVLLEGRASPVADTGVSEMRFCLNCAAAAIKPEEIRSESASAMASTRR